MTHWPPFKPHTKLTKRPSSFLLSHRFYLRGSKRLMQSLSMTKLQGLRHVLSGRNAQLDTWRRIHALYQVNRRGGEAEVEAYARAQFFESHAKLLEAIGDNKVRSLKPDDALAHITVLPAGQLPTDWALAEEQLGHIAPSSGPTEQAYRNALHAVEDVITANTEARMEGSSLDGGVS